MAVRIPRGQSDPIVDEIVSALRGYEAAHPAAVIDVYRQNSVSVRIRVVDPDFAGHGKIARSDRVWEYLANISDDTQGDISTVLLLTPDETKLSFANLEFDEPVVSNL